MHEDIILLRNVNEILILYWKSKAKKEASHGSSSRYDIHINYTCICIYVYMLLC